MIGSVVIGLVLGSLAGVFAATRRNTIHDAITMVVSFIFISIPGFVTAYLLLYIFSIKARLFPVIGGETPGNYGTYFKYLFLPCLAWGFRTTGIVSRMVRSSMIDVLNEDYVRTARSKGLSEKVVLYKHGMKNALTSVVGLMGVEIIILLGGVVIPEMVFSRPGLGRLYFMGISARDYPLIQGCVLVIATSVVLVNSIVDILYGVVDPRVRYA